MSDFVKVILAAAVVMVLPLLLQFVNLKKTIRCRQLLSVLLSPLAAIAGIVLAYVYFDRISFAEEHILYGAEVLVWNVAIIGAFLMLKLILCPIMKAIWKNDAVTEQTSSRWYEYDTEYHTWFLKPEFRNVRSLFCTLTWVMAGICAVLLAMGWVAGKESALWFRVFPSAALLVVSELYQFLSGYTKPEYLYSIGGEDIGASKVSAYYKLRRVYEDLFPSAMLVSHTGNEYSGKQGATELIKTLSESDDPKERIVGSYFMHQKKRNGLFDVDMVSITNKLIHKESAVIFNPFYRDLSDYILLPFVDNLVKNKKCLIVIGRGSMGGDVMAWANEMLKGYSRSRNLWRVKALSNSRQDCEVGILSFSQIYDMNVLNANAEFFNKTGFVVFLEPSKMLTTSQSGLSMIVEQIDKQCEPTYCVCDHDVDGLVDTMSHVLQTNITNVVAAPIPRSVYTAMGWAASGDYMRQKLFDKQTHFLGNGVELAAVALKNQIPHLTWYSVEKAPVRDIRWIAGQYYPQICRYAHLPNQQKCLDDHISFSSNLWGSAAKEDEFVIAEDEFCNLFASIRAYLTRGTSQSFVNVISENYLLRDYMRYNRQLFMTDPKAVPAVAAYYAKTERNTVLRLILMMACKPVREEYIAHELSILGYTSKDVYHTLSELIYHYTFVADTIITVQNHQEFDQDLIPVQVCTYSISRQIFEENFAETLKNAFFVVEDEKLNTEYIDARLFEHITQTVMPGQYVTYSGKYYKVHAVSPQVGCILHRAADSYRDRLYYRQLRTYHFHQAGSVLRTRKVMDVEITLEPWDFDVTSTGYLEMKDNQDLRSARVVDLSEDPNISSYNRSYKNKTVLKVALPETDVRMRFTIALLLNELFRTVFPDSWQYLAVLSTRPEDVEGMLDKFNYRADGNLDENMLYVVEDSDMDLGLVEAVENNLMHFFEILSDYLDWHFEKMHEPPYTDPVLAPIDLTTETERKRKNFFSRLAKKIMQLFAASDEKEHDKPEEEKPAEPEPAEEAPAAEEEASPFADDEEPADLAPEWDHIVEQEGEAPELGENFELRGEPRAEAAGEPEQEAAPEDLPAPEAAIPAEEQIVLHTEGEELFAIDGIPDDLDLLMPVEPSRYQKECYLKFGFDEIDSRLCIEEVKSYLTVRGWSKNDLTKARKRTELEPTMLDLNAENTCDFCGMPLTGVSYDRLSDGRTRCNECSMTAVNQVSEFRKLFKDTVMMMENLYDITIPISIAIRTTDAQTIARHSGQVFRPSSKLTPRVLGFAQRKGDRYSLFVENGSPRMAMISTTTHEMTHIWQYLNWNDREIRTLYRQNTRMNSKIARDIIYEGMAMWSEIQMLYALGETSYANIQERLAEARTDVYGVGFHLYRDRYDLMRNGEVPANTPFSSYPPLDPAIVRKLFEGDE